VIRGFLIFAMLVVLTGCASTGQNSQTTQLQMRISELEDQLVERDEQIKDLNYQVKDLSYEADRGGRSRKIEIESLDTSARSEDTGEIIRVPVSPNKVQLALKNAGYYQGPVDGKVGAKTKKAISAFQKDNNIKADGLVGRKTWSLLKTHLE
jgi:hypothetical protein